MILTFDIGGTFIKWALTKNYKILQKGKIPTPQDTFDHFLEAVEDIVKQFNAEEIEGLAFSLPGTMNKEKSQIHIGGALRYNDGRYFVKEVSEYFKLPVSMENDANAAALAEIELGHLKNSENGLVIVIGTGVGSVFVHNGEIMRGSHGYGGEISFIPNKDLNTTPFMEAIIGNQIGMRPLVSKAQEIMNNQSLTGETFMDLVEEGDLQANELIDEYMKTFAQTLFILQIVYDPDHIVIGGGVSANPCYMNKLLDYVKKTFGYCPLPMPYATIVPATFHNDSNLLGALVAYHHQHKQNH